MPPFDGDWAKILAPAATARVRGWIPLVFFGADTHMAPASVRELYEVRSVDGWGRRYRLHARPMPNAENWVDDPQVVADLAEGLQATFFTRDEPDSYIQVGYVFRLLYDPSEIQSKIERAYIIGRHYYRIEGSDYDLIDARLLAEFRLTSIH